MDVAARLGWFARGVLYFLLALLVAQLPSTGPGPKADKQGAFAAVVEKPFGSLLLVAIASGLAAFAGWRLWAAARGDREKTARRVGWVVSAAVYTGLAVMAVGVLLQGGDDGERHERSLTTRILLWPGGRWLVAAIGVAVLAVAVGYVCKAVRERFRGDLDEDAAPDAVVPIVVVVGVVGWLGRALVWALVGWFLVQAAIQHDPAEPMGLDEALHRVATEPWGDIVLWLTVAGFAAFGVLCLAITRWPDPEPAS